jgi:hypothetical protein
MVPSPLSRMAIYAGLRRPQAACNALVTS